MLLDAFKQRIGADRSYRLEMHRLRTGRRERDRAFRARDRRSAAAATGDVLVACDGLHSVIRKQLHPDEGEPVYSGVNMWRGVTRWKPFLTGAA